jgi:hypothetical protein
MLVSELFKKLSVGELSNLAMSGNGNGTPMGSGTILAASQPKLINYANEALLKLYSRFVLKENDVLIVLYDYITFYHLLPQFSLCYSGPIITGNSVKYILDSPGEQFQDDVIKILTVYNNIGRKLALNDDTDPWSVFTPQAKVLQITSPEHWKMLNVRYQQRHSPLHGDLDQIIEAPEIIWGALTAYIAYKVFSHMNTAESTAKSQEFEATYEKTCIEIVDGDLVNSSISQTNTRFHKGGWI